MTCPQYLYTFLNLLYGLKSAISQSRIFFPILFRVQISLEFKPYFLIRKMGKTSVKCYEKVQMVQHL